MGEQLASAARTKLVETARDLWVDRLIDVSRRNNLLFFRPVQSGTIELTGDSPVLSELLLGENVPAQSLLSNSKDTPSKILNISRKALENLEEKGLQTLYLAFGFATWTVEDGGRDTKAPIFLLPILFKKRGREATTIDVSVAGEPQINPVLVHVMSTDHDIEFPAAALLNTIDLDEQDSINSFATANRRRLLSHLLMQMLSQKWPKSAVRYRVSE